MKKTDKNLLAGSQFDTEITKTKSKDRFLRVVQKFEGIYNIVTNAVRSF